MPGFRAGRLDALRAKIAALETGGREDSESLAFGDPRIDGCFPGGRGLPLGRWHEVTGDGLEAETGASLAAFSALLAGTLARRGEAVWVLRRDDLYPPGLAGLGFPADRLIQVCAADEAQALAAAEDALSTTGVAVVFAEVETVDLTAGRRLQLACERRGATGVVLRRRPYGGGRGREPAGSAAATRWRVAPEPSRAAGLGLGAPCWRVTLERCRGGRPGAWLMEAASAFSLDLEVGDDAHPLRLVAELADRQLAPAPSRRIA